MMQLKTMHASVCALALVSILSLATSSRAQSETRSEGLRAPSWFSIGERGAWRTNRDTYSVTFSRGGVAFRPSGSRRGGLDPTVRWATLDVSIGSVSVMGRTSEWSRQDDRIVRAHGSVIEAYDVGPDGVEQTFVISEALPGGGDLVVAGRLNSELSLVHRAPKSDAIAFCSPSGDEIVSYGAATAIDASGRRQTMTTTVDGNRILLRLDGRWLADAEYPVVVDPLLSTVWIGLAQTSRCVVDHDPVHDELMIVYRDGNGVVALMCDDDFKNATVVFTDTSAGGQGTAPQVVRSKKGWCVAYSVPSSFPFPGEVRVHRRSLGDRTPSSQSVQIASIGGAVDVAATGSGDFLVANASVLTVDARVLDGNSGTVLVPAQTVVGPNLFVPIDDLALSRHADAAVSGTDSWLLTFSQQPITGKSEVLVTNLTSSAAVLHGEVPILLSSDTARGPRVDGGEGSEYLVTWTIRNPDKVFMQRIQWLPSSATPTLRLKTDLDSYPQGGKFDNGDVSFDPSHGQHWTAAFRTPDVLIAARIGFDGTVAERARPTSLNNGLVPGVAFDRDTDEWICVWPTSQSGNPLYGRRMTYFATGSTFVGSACGAGKISTFGGLPRAGSFSYGFRLTNAPASKVAVLWISAGSGALPLGFIGAPGCFLFVDPALMVAGVTVTTDASGRAELPFVLPSGAVLNWMAQWGYLNPGANVLGLQTTRGVQFSVR